MSREYFQALNYTLANEDTALELALLPADRAHVLSVAGSGGRVLPLLAQKPRRLTCVDLSQEQLYLCELRFESLRALNHAEFVSFWGYPPQPADPEERRRLFAKIRLSEAAQSFWEPFFMAHKWQSVLYEGQWERTFARISELTRRLTGARGAALFDCQTLDEQTRYLKTDFPWWGWRTLLFVFGNARLFNSLLYKGSFPKKNIDLSFYRFYREAFDRLFAGGLARNNFFLQIIFFGRIRYPEGCPIECQPDVFERAKAAIHHCDIHYQQGDLIEAVRRSPIPVDFLSLSDVPSYFKGEQEREFLQWAAEGLTPGSLTILRSYIHVPEKMNRQGFEIVTSQYTEAIAREKVQMYEVEVFRKI